MASQNIAFDTIPASIRKPGAYIEFNTKLAVRTLPSNKQRLLIIGQRLAAGTVAALVPTSVFSDAQAAEYFGRGSMLHQMIQAAITANRYVEIQAIAVDDAAGSAAAVSTVTLAGTATAAGTVTLSIGGVSIQAAVSSGQNAAAVAATLLPLLTAQTDWPVTTSVSGSGITVTARNKGTLGNDVAIEFTSATPGITATIAQTTAGSVDPDITATLAAMVASSHEVIVTPYNTQSALTTLRTHIDNRSDSIEQRGCIGVFASRGTLSAATTLAGQINSGRIVGGLLPSTTTPSYRLAAALAAVIAAEEDPARPLNNLQLVGVAVPNLANRLSRTEQENALANGVTPLMVGPGEQVQIVRAVTTYTTSAAGVPDISLLDVTTIRTLDYVRRACRERIVLRFPRDKLSNRTPAKVRSELLDVLLKLEELEIVEAVEDNQDGLIVERDLQDPNRLNARIPTDVVNGLHVFAGRLDLLL